MNGGSYLQLQVRATTSLSFLSTPYICFDYVTSFSHVCIFTNQKRMILPNCLMVVSYFRHCFDNNVFFLFPLICISTKWVNRVKIIKSYFLIYTITTVLCTVVMAKRLIFSCILSQLYSVTVSLLNTFLIKGSLLNSISSPSHVGPLSARVLL